MVYFYLEHYTFFRLRWSNMVVYNSINNYLHGVPVGNDFLHP
jgi:hypothetical protein